MIWGWAVLYLTALLVWIFGRPNFLIMVMPSPTWITEGSRELHPLMPYLFLANLAITTWQAPTGGKVASYAITALLFAGWFLNRDDDDRWKRRRRKIGDGVRSIGHRLVTAPGGGSA